MSYNSNPIIWSFATDYECVLFCHHQKLKATKRDKKEKREYDSPIIQKQYGDPTRCKRSFIMLCTSTKTEQCYKWELDENLSVLVWWPNLWQTNNTT